MEAREQMGLLSRDTTADVERQQIELWRRLSPVEKIELVRGTTRAVTILAEAGVRQRHPQASEHERFLRLAALKLGPDLTRLVYPDAYEILDLER